MTALSDFSRHLPAGLSAVPRLMTLGAVRDAAIEFCEDTWAFKLFVTAAVQPEDVQTDLCFVDIDLCAAGDQVEPLALDCLTVAGVPKRAQRLCLVDNLPDSQAFLTPGQCFFDFPAATVLRLFPMQICAPTNVAVRVVFRPEEDATELPDFLYNEWRRAICHGAAADLYALPNVQWESARAEQKHRARFVRAKTLAKMNRSAGASVSDKRIQIPGF